MRPKYGMPPPKRQAMGRPIASELPMQKCPHCGKKFIMRGTVEQWGPVYGNIPLCSIPCMRGYEQDILMKRVEALRKTSAITYYRMLASGKTFKQIARECKRKEYSIRTSIYNLLDFHWKELEYMEARGEVPPCRYV